MATPWSRASPLSSGWPAVGAAAVPAGDDIIRENVYTICDGFRIREDGETEESRGVTLIATGSLSV